MFRAERGSLAMQRGGVTGFIIIIVIVITRSTDGFSWKQSGANSNIRLGSSLEGYKLATYCSSLKNE